MGSTGYSKEGLSGWERFPLDADLPMSEAIRTRLRYGRRTAMS